MKKLEKQILKRLSAWSEMDSQREAILDKVYEKTYTSIFYFLQKNQMYEISNSFTSYFRSNKLR